MPMALIGVQKMNQSKNIYRKFFQVEKTCQKFVETIFKTDSKREKFQFDFISKENEPKFSTNRIHEKAKRWRQKCDGTTTVLRLC